MTLPGPVPQPNDRLEQRIKALEDLIAEMNRKTLYSASISEGGLDIRGKGGLSAGSETSTQFYVGGGSGSPHADGTPQMMTVIRDEQGRARMAVWDPANPSSPTGQQTYLWDADGHIILTTDVNGGLAEPWFSVPMYPRFQSATTQVPSADGTVYAYASVSTTGSGIAQSQLLWEGRIPSVSHPWISIDGVWGQASGAVAPTYTLKVGGTAVGSFSPGFSASAQGPYDISSRLGQKQVPVSLSVAWTGDGLIACDVVGCYLRQT